MQDLEHIVEKGEKILRLATLCSKLETQEEKVLPFGLPLEIPEEHHQVLKPSVFYFYKPINVLNQTIFIFNSLVSMEMSLHIQKHSMCKG